MKKITIILILSSLVMLGCDNSEGKQNKGLLSYLTDVTDNENAGVQDVLGFYGGFCEYSFGKTIGTGEDKKYFELKLTESEGIETYIKNPKFPASNIAYRFYRHLNKEERANYTHINAIIVFSNEQEHKFEFSTWELEAVDKKMALVNKTVSMIDQQQFDQLSQLLNDSSEVVKYDKNELIENLKKFDPQFGKISEEGFRMFGYSINAFNNKGKDILQISGAIMRDTQNNEFSLIMDPYEEKNEIYMLQYKM